MATLTEKKEKVKIIQHWIDGKPYAGEGDRTGEIYNPATGEVQAKFSFATKSEVAHATKIAHEAFPAWRDTPPAKRAEVMFAFRALIKENMEELVHLVCQEHGKTAEDGRGSILRGLEVVDFCTGIPSHLKSDFTTNVSKGIDAYSMRQPLGVCAGITPFNFPAMVPMWMFPVAIAAGNTFVLKPSEKVPSTSLFLAELLKKAGLPDGVFNVCVGDKEAVDTILHDSRIKAVSFVGSTPIAKYIYRTASENGKRVQALGGAKNHMVVMPDADVEKTTDALMGSVYGSAGQRCMAISVAVFVGEEIAENVLSRLVKRVKDLKIGPYTQQGVEMGPVISSDALARIKSYLDIAKEEGASLLVDGRAADLSHLSDKGFYIGGSIIDRVTPKMRVWKEEIFGPVLSSVRAKTYDEALAVVNQHDYGNGVSIFTRDGDSARDFAYRANIGMVGINVPIPVPVAYHSFGGWKDSLFGSHAIHGMEGVRFYTALKTITSRWPSGIRQGAQFNFQSGSA